jgi:hypothetical protein
MATKVKSIGGDRKVVQAAVPASAAFAEGDVCIFDASGKTALPATSIPLTGLTTLALTQAYVHDHLLGIACDQRLAAQDKAGIALFATAGRFLIPIADDSTARDPGTLYGVSGASDGTDYVPTNQSFVLVATNDLAVFRAVKLVAAHASYAECELCATLTQPASGAQAAA